MRLRPSDILRSGLETPGGFSATLDALRKAASYSSASSPAAPLEVPYSGARVNVEPPRAKRKRFPFAGYIDFQGLKIDVENRAGDTRRGKNPNGTPWATKMRNHYGEIRGTEGVDGDKLDTYVGPVADSPLAVVVHQQDPDTHRYDEDKVMLGFRTEQDAVRAYQAHYDRPDFYGSHTTIPIGQLWRWVNDTRRRGRKFTARGQEQRMRPADALRLAGTGRTA